jgi:clan AA aspartic protease (TIGR02281 family)
VEQVSLKSALLLFISATVVLPVAAAEIRLGRASGVYTVPVRINDVLTLRFVVDSGASEVSISDDVASVLVRSGALTRRDWLPDRLYTDASGRAVRRRRVILRSVRIGDIEVRNVAASLGGNVGVQLLGQSFLGRLTSWSIDNRREVLLLNQPPLPPPSPPAVAVAPPGLEDRDFLGRTLLIRAAAGEKGASLAELLARGAAIDARDNGGATALLVATERGDRAAVEALIAARADVNAQNGNGWTALMLAVSRGDAELAQQLIAAGADLRLRNRSAQDALALARTRNDQRLIEILQKAGAGP